MITQCRSEPEQVTARPSSLCKSCRGRGSCRACATPDRWHFGSADLGCEYCQEGVCALCGGSGFTPDSGGGR